MQNPVKSMIRVSLLHSPVSSLSPVSFSHLLSIPFLSLSLLLFFIRNVLFYPEREQRY